jgi:hypothetical protein
MMCSRCGTEKPPEAFSWKVKDMGLRHSVCKSCAATSSRAWRAANPDRQQAINRRYYSEKREPVLDQKRDYYRLNAEKIRQASKDRYYRLRNDPTFKAQRAHARRVEKYGLSPEQYAAMVLAQGGLCAICGKAPTNGVLAVDHCHTTSRIRGLLCRPCNSFLGRIKDNPAALDRMKQYLGG